MKPAQAPVVWCTPGELRKLSRLASQYILNRVVPDNRTRNRRQMFLVLPCISLAARRR